MAATSRRVSYILPSPDQPPPLLSLPPLGQPRQGHTSPFLIPKADATPNGNGTPSPGLTLGSRNPFLVSTPPAAVKPQHPRHCLGINSLALDTSTILADSNSPGGILYSGGRDGLVASWDLGVPHRRRRGARYEGLPGRSDRVKWERIGDGAEFFDDDDLDDLDEDEGISSEEETEGWIGVADGSRGEVPYEDRWEVDKEELSKGKPPTTHFRQSAQTHTDWVNAMLLCNMNQTVITASSDRTIRAWNPHASPDDPAKLSPALVGSHRDYVRALAWAKHPSLLFSGALDRNLSIWDIQSSHHEPIVNIDLSAADEYGGVGLEGERGSVYALGVDPAGHVLAAGTPERVVRLWDPRAGDKSVGKLIGHSDCVRSILFSEDGRYMLTGSSDTTIKLWSLAAHRCLHTFNHHDSSVWALHSNHPNLERFYSGSRDGILCAVDLEQCTDISDGECVVLSREGDAPRKGVHESKTGDEGIRCIVGMDDEYVWTATGHAEIKRWKDVGRRIDRLDKEFDGASYREPQDRSPAIDVAITVPSGLGVPFEPTPITDGGIRNKRLSLNGGDGELSREDSKDSRSVVFAHTPSPRNGPTSPSAAAGFSPGQGDSPASALPSAIRDRLNIDESPRRTTASGASIANSFMSESSVNGEDGESRPASSQRTTLNGVPYQSLVCLGLPDSPYSFGFSHAHHRQEDAHTLRSGVSLNSVPRGMSDLLKPNGEGSPRRISFQGERGQPQVNQARMNFEDREVASEAVPLRIEPDDIIAGRSGLVRSLLLNDRQHVLTVDTEGEVAAWNIIRGVCVGRFNTADVAEALHLERGMRAEVVVRKHSQDVLEMVKERIEGETMVITWCQVDTKIGSLVIHLEEGRVFDAEVYADDLGFEDLDGIKEDSRINLGKWALANLFQGLIKAEEREVRDLYANTPSTVASSLPSISRSPVAPQHISIDRPPVSPPHRQRALTGSFSGAKPPSLNIPGLVSPAARPAVLPDTSGDNLSKSAPEAPSYWQSFQALRTGPLSAIPQSPTATSGTPHTEQSGPSRDYFSVKKKAEQSPSRDGDRDKDKAPPTPGVPQTPGGSFMGKLKGFGKKKQAETPMLPVVERATTPEDDGPKVPEREAEQLRILDTVRSHPFLPPPPWEAPPLDYPPSTALLISEESKDAGAWVVTYRSQVSSTERDMEALEMNSPMWLLDYLFTSRVRQKDPVKLTFILEPVPGCGLKEMPEGTSRLSASRVLRARKITAFIAAKLNLFPERGRSGSVISTHSKITPILSSVRGSISHSAGGGGATLGSGGMMPNRPSLGDGEGDIPPEEYLELLCGQSVVDPKITLATLKAYYGSGPDMVLHYRMKKGVSL
ncbi:hypothetical protein CI109_103256 [Kwoniella shandongensis]|uniref:Uncharacterized protein n=1 Tax=Kwoniella shandongensis TaxID=1734106 RepID=A0A5M6BTT9_9TREE|nr:uncharacterized protein CI109_006072 [Kwoniella shandongensis]KAA5525621.1 hypothetical protein CI109_006072 [Kwoniella shandongensis]